MGLTISPNDTAPHQSGVRTLPVPAPAGTTVVIVGLGMVGHRLCEELRSRRELADARIVVFGEEGRSAYDRVHLCEVLRGKPTEKIALRNDDWYENNRIEVHRGDPVVLVDRESCRVHTALGRSESYDHLVFATGSAPVLGKIPGIRSSHVRALRTVEDAAAIRESALRARDADLPVLIIGGGLLGLELADELVRQKVQVHVLESADFPLSRQLEKSAGQALRAALERDGLEFSPRARVLEIVEHGDAALVRLDGDREIRAGLVVPAMGVRPRDQLAREAGLPCDLFGGIEVDERLQTSDPKISAVGECARHRGMAYGLVAPGYAMAEVVARRLAGQDSSFEGVQVGTRLKVEGVDVTVVGESSATGLGLRSYVYRNDGVYRRLAVKSGRIIGITAIGDWADLPRAQEAMVRAERLRTKQLRRFEQAEPLWQPGKLSLHTWPDSATVCNCMGVTCGTLKRAVREGCTTVDQLAAQTGASTVCGSCKPLLATLTDAPAEEVPEESRWMLWASLTSLMGTLAFLVLPAIPYSTTIQGQSLDLLWRDSTIKQVTGFSLAGLFSLSIVFSMRKRIKKLAFGDFEGWRIAHALIGVTCLVGAVLHTGLRLGEHLDRALILVFLGSTLLGGVAGGWSFLSERLPPSLARTLRGTLVKAHIYLLWPLPILLAAHVIKVYFF